MKCDKCGNEYTYMAAGSGDIGYNGRCGEVEYHLCPTCYQKFKRTPLGKAINKR